MKSRKCERCANHHAGCYIPGWLQFAVLACIAVTAWGCGGNPHGTVKVSGQVTIDGAPPPGPGTLSFTVVTPADGFPSRPAMAKFGVDGIYQVTSFQPGDGLVPGSYTVGVECYETPPNMEGKRVKSHIDNKYMNGETSGLELLVEPKSRALEFNIEL